MLLALNLIKNCSNKSAPRVCLKALFIPAIRRNFSQSSAFLSLDKKYTKKHEWVSYDAEQKLEGTVGITNFAQETLGDVVYVELPAEGTHLAAGDTAGVIESVKAASDIYSPVSGEVFEKNTEVEQKPFLVNKSCYEKGWLYKIRFENPKELDGLMTEEQYESFRQSENQPGGSR